MADRLTVTLEGEWVGDDLIFPGFGQIGWVECVGDAWVGALAHSKIGPVRSRSRHPTRSAAMRAVEQAVMRALGAEPSATGAEGGGDGA